MIDCINDHNAITPYKSVGAITEHLMRIAKGLTTVTPKAPECEDAVNRESVVAEISSWVDTLFD